MKLRKKVCIRLVQTDETIETFGGPNIPQQGRNIFPPNIFNLRLVETSDAAPSDVEG